MVLPSILLLLLSSAQAVTAVAKGPFESIIAFGDVDFGQGVWTLTNGTFPPDSRRGAQYYQHHLTDGRTWVEALSGFLGIPATSYGFGGATTVNNMVVRGITGGQSRLFIVPSLQEQVDKFIATNTLRPEQAKNVLWVISAGAMNGYMSMPAEKSAGPAVSDIVSVVEQLRSKVGAVKFVIPNIPMRGIKALGSGFVPSTESTRLVRYASSSRDALNAVVKSDSSIMSLDFYQWIQDLQNNPSKYKFAPTEYANSCINGLYFRTKAVPTGWTACAATDVGKYIWFDEYNPTSAVQGMWGNLAYRELLAKKWI